MSSTVRRRDEHDAFLSHATEDKDQVARPLVNDLKSRGYDIWFDEHELTVGDSLSESIDRGLARSRMGIVVISPAFLERKWPQRELRGMVANQIVRGGKLLPVWHDVTLEQVADFSPPLADLFAANTSDGLSTVADRIARALGTVVRESLFECYLEGVAMDRVSVRPGESLTVSYALTNPGEARFPIGLGASLFSERLQEHVDPSNDAEAVIEPFAGATYEREFCLQPTIAPGRYRLAGGIWLGPVGHGRQMHTRWAQDYVVLTA